MPIATSILCIASAVYHESRGESERGQLMVAHVVINRSLLMGKSPCEVVSQKGQFSWYTPGKLKIKDQTNKNKAIAIAYKALITKDFTAGATYFHNTSVKPYWTKHVKRVMKIGNHVAYRENNYNSIVPLTPVSVRAKEWNNFITTIKTVPYSKQIIKYKIASLNQESIYASRRSSS